MPFLTIPASSKPCIGRQGVRIGELEAIRWKYVNFLDFDFFLLLLYAKKNRKITKKKKIFGRLSEPMFTTFWSYKVDMFFIFDISFFKYNTDGIWVWKCQTRCKYDCRYLFFVSKHYNSLFLFVILSSCNLNCI